MGICGLWNRSRNPDKFAIFGVILPLANSTLPWRAACGVFFAVLLLGGSGIAQSPLQDVRAVPVRGIAIDGELDDWIGVPVALRIDQSEQAWSASTGPAWNGVADLSAELKVGFDRSHVYVAGRVRDNSFVAGSLDRHWHQQDAVELFFDFRADRTEPRFEDTIQLFVMPFSTERRWGRIDWPQNLPTGASLTGVRVETAQSGDEYRFEVVLPICNFAEFEPGSRSIGFDVAIDDYDEGSTRYQYMTATGRNPIQPTPQLYCQLSFVGADAPGSPEPERGGGVIGWLTMNATYLLLPLAGLLVLVLLLRGWGALEHAAPTLRPIGRVVGLLLFVGGLALPGWLVERRHAEHNDSLRNVVELLDENLDELESGALGSYGGEDRDDAFRRLLEGGTVAREKRYSYTNVRDVLGVVSYPPPHLGLGFTVSPYGIRLPTGAVERFEFREPLEPGVLFVAIARPMEGFTDPLGSTREPPSFVATQFGVDDTEEPIAQRLVFSDAYYAGQDLVRSGLEVSFHTVDIESPMRSFTISEPEGDGLELVGLTWVSPDRTEETPLSLGKPSLGGIETDLRGEYPVGAGFEVAPGRNHVIEIPAGRDVEPFDKLWLFYRATYPGRPLTVRPGDLVCELRLWERGRREARLIEFRHQETMFFGVELQNQEVPQDSDVRVALRWQDEEQEARVNFVRELDLGPEVARIEFRNVGTYPIRFRSTVFGREVRNVAVSTQDSPLQAATNAPGEEELRAPFREQLQDAKFALYRDGRMTATTLPADRASTHTNLPSDVRRAPLEEAKFERFDEDEGTVEHRAFKLLPGEWGGAILGVFVRDTESGEYSESVHLVGTLMSLLALPILLHFFSQLLSSLGNLRLRLSALFAFVMLVPLGLLSVILVGVLERGYEGDLNRRLEQAIASSTDQLRQEESDLQSATETWAQDLATQFVAASAAPDVEAELRSTMMSQRPPAWEDDGGYMLFEFDPKPETEGLPAPRSVFLGPEDMRGLSATPLRSEPGLYVAWSVPLIGVRATVELPVGSCSLSVGRRLDEDFLRGLADGRGIVLCGTNGYPLNSASGGGLTDSALRRHSLRPSTIAARATAGTKVLDDGKPHIADDAVGGATWVGIYDVLRDLQETPRAVLGIVENHEGARLPLSMGRVPVRSFFLATAVLLIVASLFLGWVMTTRISQPIERLERGARALSEGELDVHVDAEEGGQIGRLTRTFNTMATDLRGRIQDLNLLNRGFRDLTSRLELSEVVMRAIAFYTRHTPADRVRILLRDRARDRVEVFGADPRTSVDADAPAVRALLSSAGPHSIRLGGPGAGELAAMFPDSRTAVVLPLAIGDRTRGAVLLLFESAEPNEINLELHATMAVQITAAIENAWLYRHAVEDLYTGAYRPEFFHGRVAQEIGEAQQRSVRVALLGYEVGDGAQIAATLGEEKHGRFLETLFGVLRREFGSDAVLCRASDERMLVMVTDPGGDLRDRLGVVAERLMASMPAQFRGSRVEASIVTFPEDAASAEFLFDALDSRLSGDRSHSPELPRRDLPVDGMFLDSPAMESVFRTLERFAPTDISLLLEGETGVGKEMLTDVIHAWSNRASGPLVKVHCAALPPSLLQSELFGHERGAFTGAHERSIGRFEQADGGTIFLDEIGEVSLDVQVQLLRVLQEREIERVGGGKPVPVDVRIIAATHRNLREMVASGAFREDLYYRLQGMVVVVPALRDRKREIPQLVEHFRQEAVSAGQTRVRGFAPDAMDELFQRAWPGNIRELRNTVYRAMVLARGELVTRRDLLGGVGEPDRWNEPALHEEPTRAAEPRSAQPRTEPPSEPDPVEMPRPGSSEGSEPADAEVEAAVPTSVDVPGPDPEEVPTRPTLSEGELDGRLRVLFGLVRQRGSISSTEYATVAGLSPRTALRDLARLQEAGLLARDGKRRGARYRVANSLDMHSGG